MLDFYFVSKGRRLQLQRGPVGSYLDGLADELQREWLARPSRTLTRYVARLNTKHSRFATIHRRRHITKPAT